MARFWLSFALAPSLVFALFSFLAGAVFVLLLACIADDTPRTTGWIGVLDTTMCVFRDIF